MQNEYGLYGHKKEGFRVNEREVFMPVIYEPKGKAREYCELALNIFNGCTHNCKYCYASKVVRKDPEIFYNNAYPRKDIVKRVQDEAPKHKGKKVLMCFVTDPYQPAELKYCVTRLIIEILVMNGVRPVILTKAGKLARRDFDLLKEGNGEFATTLTFFNPDKSIKWEPRASLPMQRIDNLRIAKEQGIHTWVSLEPVIDPAETLRLIDETHEFVDLYKVGKANYIKESSRINWALFLPMVETKLKKYGKEYYIKNDLAKYANQ